MTLNKPDIIEEIWLEMLDVERYKHHRTVFNHWLDLFRTNDHQVPRKSQLKHSVLGKSLEMIRLSKVEKGSYLNFILTGSGIDEMMIHPVANQKHAEDFTNEFYTASLYIYKKCESVPAVVHSQVPIIVDSGKTMPAWSIALPIVDRGRVITMTHLHFEKPKWLSSDHPKIEKGKMALYEKRPISILDVSKIK